MKNITFESLLFSEYSSSSHRKSLSDVARYLKCFEDCIDNYDVDFPFSLIHYAFIFRRFDVVSMIKDVLSVEEWEKALRLEGPEGYEWITPLVCARWNLFYLYGYDAKKRTHLAEELEEMMDEIEHIDEIMEYTDIVDEDNHRTIFDLFWGKRQPLLDIIYYEKQELASLQVEKHNISLVMDEVGTGKTVSAIYAMRNVIEKSIQLGKHSHILVVCPHNKCEDWQNDIRRQLGRYAHIVEQADNGDMYCQDLKKAYFKNTEEIIMISGQKGGGDGTGSYTELKQSIKRYSNDEKWDLVIIDEGHISFDNYSGISAESAMVLTATPIVVNASGRRNFNSYISLLRNITGVDTYEYDIDPIENYYPDENDIYVNWFKEDMGIKSAERNIQFVSCKRADERHDLYYRICEEKGVLTALQYDQDDEYLFAKYNEIFPGENLKPVCNYKLDRLIDVLGNNSKSYIIFCEHQNIVDLIFNRLVIKFPKIKIAEKHGKNENHHGLENVQEGQLINTLIQALRNNDRVLFVTTGKTGGTGLNLGEFDGIIHYELPFTSIELEQRFGRVDRIDTEQEAKCRDMIFMLNECTPDDNDNEMNRMLYYCVNKIDITCEYMPIRNTVLYYPEFLRRNQSSLHQSLIAQKQNEVLSEANEKEIKEYKAERRRMEKQIKDSTLYAFISSDGKSVRECAGNALCSESDSRIDDAFYDLLKDYIDAYDKHKDKINQYNREYRKFRRLRKQINNWLSIIGLCEVENEAEIMTGYMETNDYDEQIIAPNEDSDENSAVDDEVINLESTQEQIDSLIEILISHDFDNLELKGFSSDGIFCFHDDRICRTTVEDYRRGKGWG